MIVSHYAWPDPGAINLPPESVLRKVLLRGPTLCGSSAGVLSFEPNCPLCLTRKLHGPLTRMPEEGFRRLLYVADAIRDKGNCGWFRPKVEL